MHWRHGERPVRLGMAYTTSDPRHSGNHPRNWSDLHPPIQPSDAVQSGWRRRGFEGLDQITEPTSGRPPPALRVLRNENRSSLRAALHRPTISAPCRRQNRLAPRIRPVREHFPHQGQFQAGRHRRFDYVLPAVIRHRLDHLLRLLDLLNPRPNRRNDLLTPD